MIVPRGAHREFISTHFFAAACCEDDNRNYVSSLEELSPAMRGKLACEKTKLQLAACNCVFIWSVVPPFWFAVCLSFLNPDLVSSCLCHFASNSSYFLWITHNGKHLERLCFTYMSDGAKRSKPDHNDPKRYLLLTRCQLRQLIAAWVQISTISRLLCWCKKKTQLYS